MLSCTWPLAILTAMMCCCTGCLILPVPHKETATAESRRPFSSDDLAFLRDGQVTGEQVMLQYGEPDHDWQDGRCICYGWATTDMGLLVLMGGGYKGQAEFFDLLERKFLLLEFDGEGVLRRHELKGLAGHKDAAAFLAGLEETWHVTPEGGQ